MHADHTTESLAACTADVRQWYMQNGLQLNPDKSETLVVGTSNQLQVITSSTLSVTVAGADLPLAEDMKVLGVVLYRRLTFDRQTPRWHEPATTTLGLYGIFVTCYLHNSLLL